MNILIISLFLIITMYTGVNATSNLINVMDYYNPSTHEGLQRALDAANPGKTVFFPFIGQNYYTKDKLIIKGSVKLIGESCQGQQTKIMWDGAVNYKSTKYLIAIQDGFESYASFEDLWFDAPYILDLRTNNSGQPSNCFVTRCNFSSETGTSGIALNISNHDFSVVKECSFTGFKGFCAIKVTGNPIVKATTQIKILDCNMGGESQIGISMEYIQTSTIRGNDFCGNTICGIDLGGNHFWNNIGNTNESLAYLGGKSIYTSCIGWFRNITMENNHFEWFKRGISAVGNGNGIGVYAINNNFLQGETGPEVSFMMAFENVIGIRTENNNMNYWSGGLPSGGLLTSRKCYGIYTKNCQNASFENDHFYSEASSELQNWLASNYSAIIPPPWGVDYFDEQNSTAPIIIKGGTGGIVNLGNTKPLKTINYPYVDFNLSNGSNLTLSPTSKIVSSVPAVGQNVNQNINLMKTISVSGYGKLVLMDNVIQQTCGTLYLSIHIDGCSDFLTVRNISYVNCSGANCIGLVITKTSNENDYWYSIAYENNKILLIPKYSFSNALCSVSGFFTGLNWKP